MYVENPKTAPATTEAQNRLVTRFATRYVAHAANAGARIIRTFTENKPPKRCVNGCINNAGPGRDVTHARWMPPGAHTTSENNGSTRVVTAWSIHPNDQMYRLVSDRHDPTQRVARSPMVEPANTATETPRYTRKASAPRATPPVDLARTASAVKGLAAPCTRDRSSTAASADIRCAIARRIPAGRGAADC
jgi:hypothetical protein